MLKKTGNILEQSLSEVLSFAGHPVFYSFVYPRYKFYGYRPLLTAWYGVNVLGLVWFGFIHQAGVMPVQRFIGGNVYLYIYVYICVSVCLQQVLKRLTRPCLFFLATHMKLESLVKKNLVQIFSETINPPSKLNNIFQPCNFQSFHISKIGIRL